MVGFSLFQPYAFLPAMLMKSLTAMMLSLQPATPDLMDVTHRPLAEPLFTWEAIVDIFVYGCLIGICDLVLVFITSRFAFDEDLDVSQANTFLGLNTLLLAHAYVCVSQRETIFQTKVGRLPRRPLTFSTDVYCARQPAASFHSAIRRLRPDAHLLRAVDTRDGVQASNAQRARMGTRSCSVRLLLGGHRGIQGSEEMDAQGTGTKEADPA